MWWIDPFSSSHNSVLDPCGLTALVSSLLLSIDLSKASVSSIVILILNCEASKFLKWLGSSSLKEPTLSSGRDMKANAGSTYYFGDRESFDPDIEPSSSSTQSSSLLGESLRSWLVMRLLLWVKFELSLIWWPRKFYESKSFADFINVLKLSSLVWVPKRDLSFDPSIVSGNF